MESVHDQQLDTVESHIDAFGLAVYLEAIADVCNLKADHIRGDRQDKDLVVRWDRCANAVYWARGRVKLNIGSE